MVKVYCKILMEETTLYNSATSTFQGVGGQMLYLGKKPPSKKAYSEKAFLKQNQHIKSLLKNCPTQQKDFHF